MNEQLHRSKPQTRLGWEYLSENLKVSADCTHLLIKKRNSPLISRLLTLNRSTLPLWSLHVNLTAVLFYMWFILLHLWDLRFLCGCLKYHFLTTLKKGESLVNFSWQHCFTSRFGGNHLRTDLLRSCHSSLCGFSTGLRWGHSKTLFHWISKFASMGLFRENLLD